MERPQAYPNFQKERHLRQLGKDPCYKYDMRELDRILPASAPRRKYEVVPHDRRSVNHWGQRKLLLSEIEFLTLFGKRKTTRLK